MENTRNERRKQLRIKSRLELIEHYGGKCACCGESNYKFLCIDHIDGGGNKERFSSGIHSSHDHIIFLKKNNYPNYIQILCYNCNMAKHHYGVCPHVDK